MRSDGLSAPDAVIAIRNRTTTNAIFFIVESLSPGVPVNIKPSISANAPHEVDLTHPEPEVSPRIHAGTCI